LEQTSCNEGKAQTQQQKQNPGSAGGSTFVELEKVFVQKDGKRACGIGWAAASQHKDWLEETDDAYERADQYENGDRAHKGQRDVK
jgi:hypothetical protein